MNRISRLFCQAAILWPMRVFAESHGRSPNDIVSTTPKHHSSLRRRELKMHQDTHSEHTDRQLQDVLRYVPMKLGLSLETSQSGDIDTDELNTIIGVQILSYLQRTMVEYEAVSVEAETRTLSEPVRRRLGEAQPMILQVQASGFVYFLGDSLPTSEYLEIMIESAFEGDEAVHVLSKLEAAEDPVLRSTTAVWSGLADSKEEYLAIESSSSSFGDVIMDNIVYISAGLACGVALIALFAGIQYRRSKNEDRDDLSLTEIPWLSVQVPKKAPKRGLDGESTMEAPIEAIAGETKSVMIAVAGRKPEKIALKDDISVIPKLVLPAEDKAVLLTRLYENSLCDGGIFERKSVSFDDDTSDVIIGCSFDEPRVTKSAAPTVTTPRPTTPETVRDQGQEIDINHMLSDEKSRRSIFSSKLKKKMSIKKRVSMPSLKKAKSKSKTVKQKIEYLDAVEEREESSSEKESASIPIAYLANEKMEEISTRYEMPDDKGDILAVIANTNSGIKEAWDQISRKYSVDPNWDTNTSVSSRDFENRSFQCLGPACVSTMSESHATNEDVMDDASDETTECSDEYMTQYTESEHMSQFTNPSTNASLSTGSYSCESVSTFSDDEGYSR